jgi:hypothetical protein
MLKVMFTLPLRALEGFINSLFRLTGMPLTSPDYSSLSRRAKNVKITYRPPSKGNISHLVIDATGIKVFGAGEWRQKCYGLERRRSWRKLHIAVDAASHEIVAAVASLSSVSDSEVLPTLLKPLRSVARVLKSLPMAGMIPEIAIKSSEVKAPNQSFLHEKQPPSGSRDTPAMKLSSLLERESYPSGKKTQIIINAPLSRPVSPATSSWLAHA